MRLNTMKIIALVLFAMVGSFYINQELLAYGDDIEALFKSEFARSGNSGYKEQETKEDGNTIIRTYYRFATDMIGNPCSMYVEVEKKYTLYITVDTKSKQVKSWVNEREIARQSVNGLA